MSLMHLKKTGKLKQKPNKNGKLQKNSLQKNYWANRNDLTARRTGIAFVCINALGRYQIHYNMTKRPQHFWLRSLLINSVKNNARRFGGLFLWLDARRRHSTKGDDTRPKVTTLDKKGKERQRGKGGSRRTFLDNKRPCGTKSKPPARGAGGLLFLFGRAVACVRRGISRFPPAARFRRRRRRAGRWCRWRCARARPFPRRTAPERGWKRH